MVTATEAPMSIGHQPVLLAEVLALLAPRSGGTYVDATFGGGGHTRALLATADTQVLAFDQDPAARTRTADWAPLLASRLTLRSENFSAINSLPAHNYDGALFDLGVSSFQLDDEERGFSFRHDAPADMRMNPTQGRSAATWLETAPENELVQAVRDYGEETHWRRIVRALIAARGTGQLARTTSLAELIAAAIPARDRYTMRMHPATLTFQGLRIAINQELTVLEQTLPAAFACLRSGGVLAVISFHSLEDRIVKQYFRRQCGLSEGREDHRTQDQREAFADLLTRKPITPGEAELAANPRSRSAKLRALRKH